MTTYDILVARHDRLYQQFADNPESIDLDRVNGLIAEARAAGREVSAIPQRQQLRSILRHWGQFVYERTGAYPNTHLLPYSQAAAPSESLPPEALPSDASEGAALVPVAAPAAARREAERPNWFWPVLGVVLIAAIILALMASALWNNIQRGNEELSTPLASGASQDQLPGIEGDRDGDGLSDEQEVMLGTEATNPDTDGDGLIDGAEVLRHGSNPVTNDTDGDGVADGTEVALGTSPTDPGNGTSPGLVTPGAAAPGGSGGEAIAAYPGATITTTAAVTVTVTPLPPSGPVLVVTAAEGQTTVPLRVAPGENFAVVDGAPDVPVGVMMLIVRRTPDNSWYSVELAGGARGWLPASAVTIPESSNVAAVPTYVAPQQ
jgi:hypothetical protein